MAMQNPPQEGTDAIAELVASHAGEVQPSVERGLVPTSEAARLLGISEATLLRRVSELGGKRGPRGRWMFELERLRIVREDGSSRARAVDRARGTGALAARCFPLFQATVPLEEVVVRLEAAPDAVLRLHEQWIACRQRSARWLAAETATPTPSTAETKR